MAGEAACLSNSNTRIIVCQIVTYVIIVCQIVTYEFTVFLILKYVVKLQVLCDLVVVVVCFLTFWWP